MSPDEVVTLRACLTFEEAVRTLPNQSLGVLGAASMAAKAEGNPYDETLWGLFPSLWTLTYCGYFSQTRGIHALYLSQRSARAAAALLDLDGHTEMACDFRRLARNTNEKLAQKWRDALNEDYPELLADSRAGDHLHSLRSIVANRSREAQTRGDFIEYVPLQRLLVATGEASASGAWLLMVQEVLAL